MFVVCFIVFGVVFCVRVWMGMIVIDSLCGSVEFVVEIVFCLV